MQFIFRRKTLHSRHVSFVRFNQMLGFFVFFFCLLVLVLIDGLECVSRLQTFGVNSETTRFVHY